MVPILGCIADDFTGATDLANMFVRGGMRTVQLIGVPGDSTAVPEADAIVVARNPAPVQWRRLSPSHARLAMAKECRVPQFFFKYCSIRLTDEGNIGP